MDSQQQAQVTPTNVPPIDPTPVATIPQATPVVTSSSGGSKSKMIIVALLLAVVLIALIAGGVYYYLSMQQNITPPAPLPPTSKITPVKPLSPEEELNALSVDDGAKDFAAIDKDLQTL